MTGHVEVVGRVSGWRQWSDAEKLEILAEAFRPGMRVRDVIAWREVSSSLIYTWRKQMRAGKLGGAITTDILERIGALYAVEAEVGGQPPDSRHRAREERSRPLVDALRDVLDAVLRRMSPKSDMAKAIAYATKRWAALSCFLDDGRLEIDNNIAERALRGVAVGRRNWLLAGSRARGERAAAIYTVIQTFKANEVDPQAYIADVIAKIADDWPASRWDELVPWNWSQEPAKLTA